MQRIKEQNEKIKQRRLVSTQAPVISHRRTHDSSRTSRRTRTRSRRRRKKNVSSRYTHARCRRASTARASRTHGGRWIRCKVANGTRARLRATQTNAEANQRAVVAVVDREDVVAVAVVVAQVVTLPLHRRRRQARKSNNLVHVR